jgi:hypothetical protein
MTRQPSAKISDKLNKVNDSFTVNMYENGYMIEVSGRNDEDEWTSTKIIATSLDDLIDLVREATEINRID